MEKEPRATGFEDIVEAQREGLLPTFSDVQHQHPGISDEELGWYYTELVKEFRNSRRNNDE